MADDLMVTPDLVIGAEHLQWRFSTSGGPGGQHANRSATRAELVVDLQAALAPSVAARLERRLGKRSRGGVVSVAVDETRSQAQNRRIARQRLAELLASALEESTPRRPTRPTGAARERRLAEKRKRSEIKAQRREPPVED